MYGVHRLSGIITPANAEYSAEELQHQLVSSGAKGLVTCVPLLETALRAAKGAGIPEENVFVLDLPGLEDKRGVFTGVEELIEQGRNLAELEGLRWTAGQGARQPAFLSYSSGTSGLPVINRSFPPRFKGWQLTAIIESRHHIPPQRHCQHPATRHVRVRWEEDQGGRRAERDRGMPATSIIFDTSSFIGVCRC